MKKLLKTIEAIQMIPFYVGIIFTQLMVLSHIMNGPIVFKTLTPILVGEVVIVVALMIMFSVAESQRIYFFGFARLKQAHYFAMKSFASKVASFSREDSTFINDAYKSHMTETHEYMDQHPHITDKE